MLFYPPLWHMTFNNSCKFFLPHYSRSLFPGLIDNTHHPLIYCIFLPFKFRLTHFHCAAMYKESTTANHHNSLHKINWWVMSSTRCCVLTAPSSNLCFSSFRRAAPHLRVHESEFHRPDAWDGRSRYHWEVRAPPPLSVFSFNCFSWPWVPRWLINRLGSCINQWKCFNPAWGLCMNSLAWLNIDILPYVHLSDLFFWNVIAVNALVPSEITGMKCLWDFWGSYFSIGGLQGLQRLWVCLLSRTEEIWSFYVGISFLPSGYLLTNLKYPVTSQESQATKQHSNDTYK